MLCVMCCVTGDSNTGSHLGVEALRAHATGVAAPAVLAAVGDVVVGPDLGSLAAAAAAAAA